MSCLLYSRIGLHLGEWLPRVEGLGVYRDWVSGEFLCRRDEVGRTLHVVTAGVVRFEGGNPSSMSPR